jgi:predicted TIM-barrel fold metal-dependent hydrolase
VTIIDSDQHLYEPRTLWAEHIDPAMREDALAIVDDDLGYPWLTWRGRRLGVADIHLPGDTESVGRTRRRVRRGDPPEGSYDDRLPDDYWSARSRVEQLDRMGVDEAVVFPNFGLLWERRLSASLPALTANMGAWNRWCASVAHDGGGRLHPVAHLTLRDEPWALEQLQAIGAAGIRLAMIAPAAVDGLALSHPDFDRLWSAFVDHGITPVFHVADQPRLLDDAFFPDEDESFVPVTESVFLWVPAAVAVTDLIVNGAFTRHPGLRVAIVELSSIWVPQYLLMLDGGWDFTNTLNGRAPADLPDRPSAIFRHHVRVSSFSYERPAHLAAKSDDIFMCCSDYPHSEGTATPLEDYRRAGCAPEHELGLFGGNIRPLLAP